MSGRTRSQNRSRGRNRNRSRGMMGGSHAAANVTNAGFGGGAADWVIKNFGLGDTQWNNTFGPQSLGVNTGNLLPTVVGAPAVLSGMTPQGTNSPSQLLKMSGGRRRRRMKRTKGGMGMLTTAAVPLTLLALQQTYGTRRNGSSRRGSRRRGSRRRGSRRR